MKVILTMLLLLFFVSQKVNSQTSDTAKINKLDQLNIYIDCDFCDIDHIKKNITIVNYVRDPKEADVHLIITRMQTGGGGNEYTASFNGKNKFKNLTDTLTFTLPANTTEFERREAQIKNIKVGLTPFILKTPYANKINIVYDQEEKTEEIVEDKWKNWVFSSSVSGYINGESSYSNYYLWTRLNAQKITDDIKLEISYTNSYQETVYKFEESTSIYYTKENNGKILFAKSLGDHWAAGSFFTINTSTYSNIALSEGIYPAIEYNFFKYKDATTKQLRVLYKIGYKNNAYVDTTIFNKLNEGLGYHGLSIYYEYVQKWGSVESSVYGSNYFTDFESIDLGMYLGGSIRLFKGLSLTIYGGYNQKRNQISLPKETLSAEDILLRRKEMASEYSYWANFGLSYTFGSIYNNIVNARFGD